MALNDGCKSNSINFDEDYMEEEVKMEKGGSDEFRKEDEEGERDLNNVDEMDENEDEPDFLDNSGKIWDFACEIQDERHLKKWCRKMGAIIVSKDEKLTRQYECSIEECPFQIIFLKSRSIVYTRNGHNHGEENEENIQIKQEMVNEPDHVDCHGKHWPFHSRIDKNYSEEIFLQEFGFSRIRKNKTKTHLYLECQRRSPTGGTCPFAGIYLEENECLYTRGKHEHSKKRKVPQNIKDDYEDNYGHIWKFKEEIDKNVQPEIFFNKYGLTICNTWQVTVNLRCQKIGIDGGKCPFRGIYIKKNGCLYVRGKHEHKY